MNIMIDETTHDHLQKQVIDTIEFGSVMKGNQNEESDHDYLHIISPSIEWLQTPYNTHHLLQFRDGDADHIYCTPHTFVKSLLDGDTTIFHEIHHWKALDGTCLAFLQDFSFDHYTTQRAYLGIAKRDLKDATRLWNSDRRKSLKKVKFAIEAFDFVGGLNHCNAFVPVNPTTIQELQQVCNALQDDIELLRKHINVEFDAGNIPRTCSPDVLMLIDRHLHEFEQESYLHGMKYFREVFYNGFSQ